MPELPQFSYISSTEAAKRYNFTNDHVGLLCRRKKINATLLGRLWYVDEESLKTYIRKSSEVKELRKRELSKQWSKAWAAIFIAAICFGSAAHQASAYEDVLQNSLMAAGQTVGEIQEALPRTSLTSSRKPTVHIVYADGFINYESEKKDTQAASVVMSAPVATIEQLTEINMLLDGVNQNMFGLYALSADRFIRAALFDADVVADIWDHTFGAIGEHFVSDIYALLDNQMLLYSRAAIVLQNNYDAWASEADPGTMFGTSISVASVAYIPNVFEIVQESAVGKLWTASVNMVSDLATPFFVPPGSLVIAEPVLLRQPVHTTPAHTAVLGELLPLIRIDI